MERNLVFISLKMGTIGYLCWGAIEHFKNSNDLKLLLKSFLFHRTV